MISRSLVAHPCDGSVGWDHGVPNDKGVDFESGFVGVHGVLNDGRGL